MRAKPASRVRIPPAPPRQKAPLAGAFLFPALRRSIRIALRRRRQLQPVRRRLVLQVVRAPLVGAVPERAAHAVVEDPPDPYRALPVGAPPQDAAAILRCA